MQHCSRCKINIRGDKRVCPLCGGPLSGDPVPSPYPVIRRRGLTRALVVRAAAFSMIAIIIVMLLMNYLLDGPSWIPLAIITSIVGFADICLTVYFRWNQLKIVTWEIYVGMIVSVLVDFFTGWHAWSVVWVLPAAFLGLMIITAAVGSGLKMRLQDFVLYLLLHTVVSLLQFVLVWKKINPFPLPALISEVSVILFFAAVVIFRWRDFKSASSRYFNL